MLLAFVTEWKLRKFTHIFDHAIVYDRGHSINFVNHNLDTFRFVRIISTIQ